MNKIMSLVVLGIALAGVLIYFMSVGTSSDIPTAVPESSAGPDQAASSVASVPSASPASAGHVDPTDNKMTDGGPAVPQDQKTAPELEPKIREALGDILDTSSEGLVEETRDGTTSVHLQGRFRTAPVATIDENGDIHIKDYTHLPKAGTQP